VELIRLSAPELNFHVDVSLYRNEDKWLAVAVLGGDLELGLGLTAGEAIARSLESIGAEAAAAFLESLPPTATER